MTPERILWVDIETTGLNPWKDVPLEIALVVTDGELERIGQFNCALRQKIDVNALKPIVRDMHTKNGLWHEVINNGLDPIEAPRLIDKFLRDHLGEPFGWGGVLIGGSSVHFDKEFAKIHKLFPVEQFSHRVIDVSTIRTCLALWNSLDRWSQNDLHRALGDITNHIEELQYYRRYVLDKRLELV